MHDQSRPTIVPKMRFGPPQQGRPIYDLRSMRADDLKGVRTGFWGRLGRKLSSQ